jgi:hypothetical protein
MCCERYVFIGSCLNVVSQAAREYKAGTINEAVDRSVPCINNGRVEVLRVIISVGGQGYHIGDEDKILSLSDVVS